jgi:hypothetical protein
MFPYLMQGKNVVLVIDNKTHTVNDQHLSYKEIIQAIKDGDWETVQYLVETKDTLTKYSGGNVTIEDDQILWKGKVLENVLTAKMIAMFKEGFTIDPLIAFLENLMLNPSKRAVTELYGFLEKGAMPITPDGHFLAFKKVRYDYKDVHTGTFDNSVGQIVSMERNDVDDDRDRTCSTGLHFCSQDYLNNFGGDHIMIVKINPRDVVSIPSDYNDTKGRCCRYEVIGELQDSTTASQAFTKAVQQNASGIFDNL